jgi:trehalose utilization protein
MIHVMIYNEFMHEREDEAVRRVYPEGIHMALKEALEGPDISVRTTTLDDVADVLTLEELRRTDVLLWWGHMCHDKVPDEVAERVRSEVMNGMGAVFLHSAHFSKPFRLLMGTNCSLSWRENGDWENIWVCDPSHPISAGVNRYIALEHEEVYTEPFLIPEPDKLVFVGSYRGGEAFRSGCCYQRGYGRVFYFQPGHESYPTYRNPDVIHVIQNAVRWAKPEYRVSKIPCPQVEQIKRV